MICTLYSYLPYGNSLLWCVKIEHMHYWRHFAILILNS